MKFNEWLSVLILVRISTPAFYQLSEIQMSRLNSSPTDKLLWASL
jgi:hypothetical protein